jgi:LysR family glycine cleavage system transcriptional activator/LysR family transcriptional regulator of beta-lactamase
MPGLPSLNGLRAFEASARLGSFTLAAQSLHVTQAAISRSVKSLESQLGYALFERSANSLALTESGRQLLPDVSSAFGLVSAALGRVRANLQAPVLTVGVGPTFAMRWLIPRLAIFQELHPEIEVRTTTAGPTAELRPDWPCSVRLGKDSRPGIVSEALFTAQVAPVCNPAMAAKLQRHEDLFKVPLLDVAPTEGDWSLWLDRAGIDPKRMKRATVFPFHAFALQAALDGLGVAMGIYPYVIDDLKAGRLVRPFNLSVSRPIGWYLTYRREALSMPAFVLFRRWLRREARTELVNAA